jgi:predicted dinucleotide-binding enzyme
VKAFNTVGVQQMIDPRVECAPPTMPICGNDRESKDAVGQLLREVGWEPVDYGGVDAAPVLDAMIVAWVLHGRATGAWDHCYKLVVPPT